MRKLEISISQSLEIPQSCSGDWGHFSGQLTPEQKAFNRQLARQRVGIEHVNRRLKIFRILSGRYRNRRHRFGLRCNLIAGLYNFERSQGSSVG